MRNITVYCSSSSKVDPVYLDAARQLGTGIAQAGWGLVYGGNRIGMMGVLADAARAAGGRVVGVTPRMFIEHGHGDDACDELIVSTDMRDRKQILIERGDALVALPGGLGTLEEIFDAMISRQFDFHHKPMVLLNIAGFYDPLLAMIEHGIAGNFIKAKSREIMAIHRTVDESLEYLRNET